MTLHHLAQEQILPITLDEAWDFFSSPRNLDSITPPELGFRIVHCPSEKMHDGQIIEYRVKVAPAVWVPWVTEIKAVKERHSFVDEQRAGPYKFWHHRHVFEETDGGVKASDLVHYALPFGPAGAIAHAVFVRSKLERIFSYRREILAERFAAPGQRG